MATTSVSIAAARHLLGRQLGEYKITGVLGRGGMGMVLSAVHPIIGTEVAVKVLDARLEASDAALRRFIQEARAANQIRHPNIIEIFGFGNDPGLGHYFVMPRLVGSSVAERIDERGYFSVEEALPVLEQIADGLDAVHAADILHRDLKPENVFLEESGGQLAVTLLDFGIAKLAEGRGMTTTETGVLMGTPLFIAPEQWNNGPVDHRIDIYAFGVLMYYMLTARYPFESASPVELMTMHTLRAPTPASSRGAPAYVDAIIARALEKNPDRRASTARELVELLRAANETGQSPDFLAPPPWPRRAAAGGVIAAALAAVAALALPGDRQVPLGITPPVLPAPAPPPAPIPQPVRMTIDSMPAGAAVSLDGEPLGVTPLRAEVEPRHRARLELSLPGRVTTSIDIPLASDFASRFELVEAPRERPRARRKARRRQPARPVVRETVDRPEPPKKTRWGETIKERF